MTDVQIDLRDGILRMGKDEFIAQLHQERPLCRDVNGFWVASRFDDVRAILLDHSRYSSSAMGGGGSAGPMGGMGVPLLTDDPPRHSVLRGLLAKAFTPTAMEAMRPNIERLARGLAAAIPMGQEVDIVEAMTTPLPVAVISGMMGVPRERAMDFKRWSNAIMGIQDNPFEGDRIKMLMELRAYFTNLAAERRASPGADLVSDLTKVGDTTETLTDDQVVGFCILLMIAGNETTTNLLGNLINRIADEPKDWALLREHPSLVEGAIEESLRVDSPAQMVIRRATEDVAIGGVTIPAGERVMIYLASANRDPSKWDDPANFELARERERHVAFGHGVHTCIGAPLARMEAKAAMSALVERFSLIGRGQDRGKRLPGGLLFGFRSLPVVFG
ncbi:MAG TPA: cytochrome P450 [Caulobacteraceae bacterium]|nr:cytochrome P450 [Caulobacteraceae bacterium]